MSTIAVDELVSQADWDRLRSDIDATGFNPAVAKLIEQLKAIGARSAVIERRYLDQDFTELYSKFYAGLFKRHQKTCQRYHFFKTDVRSAFQQQSAGEVVEALSADHIIKSYIGFIVVRPVKHAPLGRVMISPTPDPVGIRIELMVKSEQSAHLCGVDLTVVGTAMTQQDSRVGACAQAAIWMAGRHFYHKHKGPWFSTAAITDAATPLADVQISRMVPAGSESLHPNNMLQALRAMQREPYFYAVEFDPATSKPQGWKIPPHEIIHRYIDSGIPVILGIAPQSGSAIGHAALATGLCYDLAPKSTVSNPNPTRAEFLSHFLANDDQLGPNILVPLKAGLPHSDTTYNIEDHLWYLIIPLPKKVFLSAETAEAIAWDTVNQYSTFWSHGIRPKLQDAALGDAFISDRASNKIIARTYLTYGWKYKARMLRNTCSDVIKNEVLYLELPRYVWVCEFGSLSSLSKADSSQHRISAHAVIDATASRYWNSLLLFHAPGLLATFSHDSANEFADYKQTTRMIIGDQDYKPKVRGVI